MDIFDIIDFLIDTPPFQSIDDSKLEKIAKGLTAQFYPKGTFILKQDGRPNNFLYLIYKGGVKVYRTTETGEEIIIDFRGERDTIGFLSLLERERTNANAVTIEDTICYLMARDTVLHLLETNPFVSDYFLQSHLDKYINKPLGSIRSTPFLYSSSRHLFKTRLEDIALKEVKTVTENTTIRDSAGVMSANRISSLIIVNKDGDPVGIITDRDLRDRVVSQARNVDEPVSNIMSPPAVRVDTKDVCFEAVLKMIQHNIHHIIVMRNGQLKGMLTNHDLMVMQGTSPISVVKDIEGRNTLDELVSESRNIEKVISLLLKEGAKASSITAIITEINDRLVGRLLELIEKRLGAPPLPYCWIVFGSEGRKEQTYKTDQDNAIIYQDPKKDAESRVAEEYFQRLAEEMKDALLRCGFPLCPGNYMAANSKWCQPLATWEKYFSQWVHTPTSDATLASCIVFDFRPAYGDFSLAQRLRSNLIKILKNQDLFLKHMAQISVQVRPPLGFFRTFVVERSGEHKNHLNLKFTCLAPLINIVRLFSLENRIPETSTIERIHALSHRHSVVTEFGGDLEHAFEFLSFLRIRRQHARIEEGLEPDNYLDPNELNNFERKVFKESCQLIAKVQDIINKKYNPGTGSIL